MQINNFAQSLGWETSIIINVGVINKLKRGRIQGARQIGRGIHPQYWITCGFPLSYEYKGCLYLIETRNQ